MNLAYFGVVLLALFVSPVVAGDYGSASKIALSAVADVSSIPAGDSGTIAVRVDVAPDWHIQSAKPNDENSIPTVLKMSPSPEVTFAPPLYPKHSEIPGDGLPGSPLTQAVYVDHVVFLVPFTVSKDAAAGPITISGKLNSQACSDVCIAPTDTPFTVTLAITAAGTPKVVQNQEVFAAARKQKFLSGATAPATGPATAPELPKPAAAAPVDQTVPGKNIGLLGDQEQIALIQSRHYHPYNDENLPLWWIIVSALAGGAILNIMPCVLPVIPLKVLGLVQQAHGDRRLAIFHGLTFSAGIITLFVALAVVLKVAGLFYGQQFQSAWFLIAMGYLVLALALSMLGVWTIQTPQAVYAVDKPHSGYLGSFSSGLLATLLATPCSAPYLGPVLGWALLQPAWITALALGLVGVGMSLPYLILAAFPGLLAKMPKAGRWSELLKQGLGIVMVGVGVYLLMLVPNSTMWPFIFYGAVVLGLICWAWGQIPTGVMEPRTVWTIRGAALGLGIAAGAGLYVWGTNTLRAESGAPAAAGVNSVRLPDAASATWLPFNVAIMDQALKDGRPVVVDWGANWCINCRVLEARVLRTGAVEDAFMRSNAVLLRADETVENPPTAFLNRELGGQSIPVLAIFSPGRPLTPVVLRDNYSKERVMAEVEKAGSRKGS